MYYGLPDPDEGDPDAPRPPVLTRFTHRTILRFKATHYVHSGEWVPYASFDPMPLTERDWEALQVLRDELTALRRGASLGEYGESAPLALAGPEPLGSGDASAPAADDAGTEYVIPPPVLDPSKPLHSDS